MVRSLDRDIECSVLVLGVADVYELSAGKAGQIPSSAVCVLETSVPIYRNVQNIRVV